MQVHGALLMGKKQEGAKKQKKLLGLLTEKIKKTFVVCCIRMYIVYTSQRERQLIEHGQNEAVGASKLKHGWTDFAVCELREEKYEYTLGGYSRRRKEKQTPTCCDQRTQWRG